MTKNYKNENKYHIKINECSSGNATDNPQHHIFSKRGNIESIYKTKTHFLPQKPTNHLNRTIIDSNECVKSKKNLGERNTQFNSIKKQLSVFNRPKTLIDYRRSFSKNIQNKKKLFLSKRDASDYDADSVNNVVTDLSLSEDSSSGEAQNSKRNKFANKLNKGLQLDSFLFTNQQTLFKKIKKKIGKQELVEFALKRLDKMLYNLNKNNSKLGAVKS
jgi:hypothetical protein